MQFVNEHFYTNKNLLINFIVNSANKYWNIVTDNKYKYLINYKHKISKFYMNPKLHKSKVLKEIIKNQSSEYINIIENLQIEVRPIVAKPVYCTTRILECYM